MSLFLTTTGTDVEIEELGYIIVHPTSDYDISAQFTSYEISNAETLTSAILAGTLIWKRSSGGNVEIPSDYDPDYSEVEELSEGPSVKTQNFRQGESRLYLGEDLNFLVERIGRSVGFISPDSTTKVDYLANGDINFIEWFNSSSQVVANRTARVDMTYDGNLNPTMEALKIYGNNGSTILKTFTWTYTFSGVDLISYSRSVA